MEEFTLAPDVTVPFTVKCDECGHELKVSVSDKTGRYDDRSISVEPCKDCQERACDEARQEGKEKGDAEGYERGRQEASEP